jgi:hypothetical protein
MAPEQGPIGGNILCSEEPGWAEPGLGVSTTSMRCSGAAFERAALFQDDLPEGGKRMRHQIGPVAFGCEQDQVGEALADHGCHLDEVCVAALKAILHELVDLTVQTVGHLVPPLAAGRARPAHAPP